MRLVYSVNGISKKIKKMIELFLIKNSKKLLKIKFKYQIEK